MAHVGGQVFGRKRSTFLLGEDDPEILLSRKKVQNGVTQGGVTGNAGRAGSSWLIAAAFMGQLLDSIKWGRRQGYLLRYRRRKCRQAGTAAFGKALIIQSSQAAPGTENRWCRRDLAGGYLTAPLWDQRRDEGLACLTLPQRASATYSGYDPSEHMILKNIE
jgi:hypothetical protein